MHKILQYFDIVIVLQFSFVTEGADGDLDVDDSSSVPLKQLLRLGDCAVKASASRCAVSHDAAFDAWWHALVVPFKVRATIIHVSGWWCCVDVVGK
jgi:hypothetical protein